jgi:DNA-binding transcriptional MerR regulator
MTGYKISEAARATGFTVSALRFYEQEGVVVPARTDTGYRSYREHDLESLLIVARAKRLGLRLEQISELLDLLREDECRPVQTRMHHLVTDRIAEARQQVADLVSLIAQLQETASRLTAHTPDGGCDEECGCRTDSEISDNPRWESVSLAEATSPLVACKLEPDLVGGRIDDWKAMVDQAVVRDRLPDGIRLRFSPDIDVAALSQLAADEQMCCGFFAFNIGIHADSVTLEVRGPADAQPVIIALFGLLPQPTGDAAAS